MPADHNYMAFTKNEHSFTQVLSLLSGVLASSFEKLSKNHEDTSILSVSATSVQKCAKESNYTCNQCGLHVLGSSEELRKHYFHIALKIYSCGNCGLIYKSEESLNEHLNKVHAAHKETAQSCSTLGGRKQAVKRVIVPVLLLVKEWINSSSNRHQEESESESSNDDLGAANVSQQSESDRDLSPPLTKFPFDDIENPSSESPLKAKKLRNPIQPSKVSKQLPKITRKNHPLTRIPCLKCGKAFSSKDSLGRHNRRVHMKVYDCEKCEDRSTFRTLSSHLKHAQTAHNTRRETSDLKSTDKALCETCGKQFKSLGLLRRHRVIHKFASSSADYMCSQCGKAFPTIQRLRAHEATHTSEKPYICDICGKRLKWKRSLVGHIKRHYNIKNLSCDICSKRFDNKSNLIRHVMIHTGEKPFVCDVCNRSFRQKVTLQAHMLCHSDAYKYVCDICGKMSRQNSNHKKHMLLHSEKGEDFKNKRNYRRHELSDSQKAARYRNLQLPLEDRYKCDQCGKRLQGNSHLRLHMMKHSDERNFKCEECGKLFKYESTLQLHKNTHLSKISPVRYQCKMCNKRFREVRYVKTHIKYFHPEAIRDKRKFEDLYQEVPNEQHSPPKKCSSSNRRHSPRNKPPSSKRNSVQEQDNTVEALQNLYVGVPETTVEDVQQGRYYYVL